MLTYPSIHPILLDVGFLQIHWYGVMYLIAFAMAWLLGQWRASQVRSEWPKEKIDDLVFYGIVGVVLGGRLGYMIFYALPTVVANPVEILKVWQGGMSFHGGLIGVLVAMALFARRNHKAFFQVADTVAPLVPLGLAAGRLGNFINGELWGKTTTLPWGVVFPHAGPLPRHPSQLYEFLMEGVVLFLIIWFYSAKPRPRMAVSGLFALGYGVFRCTLEAVRVPDAQYGYLAWHWLTMGQVLSLPLILGGILLLYRAYAKTEPVVGSKQEWCS